MAPKIIVEPLHFSYLRLQKGKLDRYANDFALWLDRYQVSLKSDMDVMIPYLPHDSSSVLDVGSGLGGIDALLNKWYGGDLSVTLLDGEADPPVMKLHRQTFNDMEVARDFLRKNGVKSISCLSPDMAKVARRKFDLVISLGSWCFHYPPSFYLDFVKQSVHSGTILILDVRAGKKGWEKDLEEAFDFVGNAITSVKWARKVYRVR